MLSNAYQDGYSAASYGDLVISVPSSIADEPNPTPLVVGGSVSGVIDVTGDVDDISVTLVAGQTYLISLRGTGGNPLGDTFLEVYNPSAALVNFDDDGGNGTFSLMTITASVSGSYTIRASAFSNPGDPGTGGYTVDVRVQGADAVGSTNATAVALGQGTTFGFRETATVSGGADLDRYAVELEGGKFYTFKLAAGADYATDYTAVPAGEIDTILRLRNAGGTLVAQNDDNNFPSDISSGFGFLAPTTGTYYLDVTGYAGQTGGYVIDFQEVDLSTQDPLQSLRWEDAANIDTVMVDGKPTAYVYFGAAGETFGETTNGVTPITTFGWNATEKAAVMSALLEYTKITGITYLETANIGQAEFRLNTVNTGNFGAYFYPQDPSYGSQEGIGIFNVNSGGWDKPGVSTQDIPGNQVSLDKGGFAYAVILHEFGHAHGVAHPHDNGGGSDVMLGVTGPTNSYGVFNLNQGVYTVMSYNDAWDFHPDGPSPFTIGGIGNGWSGTLGAFDIAVLQERYGVHAYATGDNVYTLASVQQSGVYYETIWDTGGTDTIAYNSTGRATIDLLAATLDYSPTGGGVLSFVDQIPGTAGLDGIFGGFTIAKGVVIENATGGSGNDTLLGNSVANVITGNNGDDFLMGRGGGDTLNGGAGFDTASYKDSAAGVNASLAQNKGYTGDAQGDTFILIEKLEGSNHADTLTGGNNADHLFGLGGVDTIDGGNGNDTIDGGAGADNLKGGNGDDTINGGDGVDTIDGGNNNDTINGGADNDNISGGGGDDKINGGAGNDTINGGGGIDRFLFSDAGTDTINAYQKGEIIDLSAFSNVDSADVTITNLGKTVSVDLDGVFATKELVINISGAAVTAADIFYFDGNAAALQNNNMFA